MQPAFQNRDGIEKPEKMLVTGCKKRNAVNLVSVINCDFYLLGAQQRLKSKRNTKTFQGV